MDIIIGVIIGIVLGGLLGFIVSKQLSASSQEHKKLAEQANQSENNLAQYRLDVAEHLDQSTQLLTQMNESCQKAMLQMEQSTKLLQQATPTEQEAMPFFAKETQEQLAQTANLRHNREEKTINEQLTQAPLDYSGNPSGLFDDKKQNVTNAQTTE
jgi:hypothetical protein